jgi:hypothetical protein
MVNMSISPFVTLFTRITINETSGSEETISMCQIMDF